MLIILERMSHLIKEVILYKRPQCHLCDDALLQLELLQPDFNFKIKEININESDELIEMYGLYIPVIEIDGNIIQYGQVDMDHIYRYLQKFNK